MAIYGALTIINTSGTDLRVRAHQRRRGPRVFTVNAGHQRREDGIRLSTDDVPGDKRKRVQIFDEDDNIEFFNTNQRYRVALLYEVTLTVFDCGNRHPCVEEIFPSSLEKIEDTYFANLQKELSDFLVDVRKVDETDDGEKYPEELVD